MRTCCGKVISYLNDKYHGGLGAVANPLFPGAFVQINAIKRIILFRVVRFFSPFEEKIRCKGDIERFKGNAKKAENGEYERRWKRTVQFGRSNCSNS